MLRGNDDPWRLSEAYPPVLVLPFKSFPAPVVFADTLIVEPRTNGESLGSCFSFSGVVLPDDD